MTTNREIELKFELEGDDQTSRRLSEALERRFGPGRTVELVSTYFDTADLALREAATSLRIRKAGGRRFQTVKAPAAERGPMFARAEWEAEIAGDCPDLALTPGTPLDRLLHKDEVRRTLAPTFETVVKRTTWEVAEDGGTFELALDQGLIKADGRTAPICELEVELKSGRPQSLLSLARSLDSIEPMRLGGRSKADRGYELLELTETSPAASETPRLTPEMTAAEAFQTIASGCIRHFLRNEPLLIRQRQAAALHQTRVALRRLRSAMSLFRSILQDSEFEPLKERLRSLAQSLGAARDLDVFIAAITCEPADAAAGAKGLAKRARAERERAYDEAIAEMGAPGVRRLMFDLSVWVEAGPWTQAGGPAGAPVSEFAQGALERRRRKLIRSGKPLPRLSDEERHEVRIKAKKLRYAIEFFACLYPSGKSRKRADELLRDAKALQTSLGDLNDTAQAMALSERLAEAIAAERGGVAARRELIFAAGMAAGRRLGQTSAFLDAAADAEKRLTQAKPFWR